MLRKTLLGMALAGAALAAGCHHCHPWLNKSRRCPTPCDPCVNGGIPPGAPAAAYVPGPPPVNGGPTPDAVVPPSPRPAYYYGPPVYYNGRR